MGFETMALALMAQQTTYLHHHPLDDQLNLIWPLKASTITKTHFLRGERYKNIREAGKSLSGTGSDERTSMKSKAIEKIKNKNE